jgi:hypothetical protein
VPEEAAGATSSDINARSKAEKNSDDSMANLNEWRMRSFLFSFRCAAQSTAQNENPKGGRGVQRAHGVCCFNFQLSTFNKRECS